MDDHDANDDSAPDSERARERTEHDLLAELQRERAAREEAERANRAKDEFLAMLGHELRNPLSPILTAVHLCRSKGAAKFERELGVIERQAQHMVRLIDDLLDVSRIARGKVAIHCESVEIAEVVTAAIEIARPLLERARHRLWVDVPNRGRMISADRTRMAQVLANLLTNAAKYTPEGGDVWISASNVGDRIEVKVQDSGVGIDADLLPHVFGLFVQSRQTLDRSRGGLGLGLTIVKNLVAMHGGTVTAESAGIGKGSTFTVSLPAVAATPPSRSELGDERPRAPRHRRVLIVYDNADAAEMLSELLQPLGYVTAIAHDGPQALAVAPLFMPDVALVDIGLPNMDGRELAERLRAIDVTRDLFLVAITGSGRGAGRERAREAGFHEHLTKPVDPDDLLKLLERRR